MTNETRTPSAAPLIAIALVLIALSLAVAAYVVFGFTVTASTGVMSSAQRDEWRAMAWGCVATFVLGVVLLVAGIWKWRAARRSRPAS